MPVAQLDTEPDVSSLAPSSPASAKVGASLTAETVIVTVWAADVSTPPLAVPPLSWIFTPTCATPFAFAVGVKVRVPFVATAGPAENRPRLSFDEIWYEYVWVDSF